MYNDIEVIIPMRGDCKYVKETLESIVQDMGQHFFLCVTYADMNISVEDVVQSIAPQANVRYIDASGFTLAEVMNIAVSSSLKKYILRIDSDDKVIKGRASKQLRFLEENLDTAVVGSQVVFINENSKWIGQSQYNSETFSDEFGFGCRLAQPSVMFRRSQIISIGSYLDVCNLQGWSICEDYDLWLRVIEKYRIAILDEPLTEYRYHGTQLTHKFEVEVFLCSLLLRARKILGETRKSIVADDLRFDSSAIKSALGQIRDLDTPESKIWLLEYAIFGLRKYPAILNNISKHKTMYFIKNIHLWIFCLRFALLNKGSYKREISNFRSALGRTK